MLKVCAGHVWRHSTFFGERRFESGHKMPYEPEHVLRAFEVGSGMSMSQVSESRRSLHHTVPSVGW